MPNLNKKAINAIKNFQNKIDSMGLPFVLLRKLNGIRNAIEMHVEDYMVFPEVFECLCKAYIEQAKIFKEPYRNEIISAFRKCEKKIRKSLIKKAERIRIDCVSAANHDLIRLLDKPGVFAYSVYKEISFFEQGVGSAFLKSALFSRRGSALTCNRLQKINYFIKLFSSCFE